MSGCSVCHDPACIFEATDWRCQQCGRREPAVAVVRLADGDRCMACRKWDDAADATYKAKKRKGAA